MGFDDWSYATLSQPKVQREPDECLASWLLRIGMKLALSKAEIEHEIGVPLAILNFAQGADALNQVTSRTGQTQVIDALHPDNRFRSPECISSVPGSWAACATCLEEDRAEGKQPYIRIGWTHPLCTICLKHLIPLNALGDLSIWEDNWCLAINEPLRSDTRLDAVEVSEIAAIQRAAAAVAEGTADVVRQLTDEISDLVDALSVQANLVMGPGSVLGVFERRRRGRSVRSWSTQLPHDIMYALSAADRLLIVRTALSIRWPTDPGNDLGDWVSDCINSSVPQGRRRAVVNQQADPLLLLALALPIHNFHQLSARSCRWSADLRYRWQSCAMTAAFSGFN